MYKKISKKGFTLIELLAVILILAIIALIAVPVVNNVLDDSRMGAFKTTTMNLASKAEEICQLEGIKDKETTHLYTIVDGKLDKSLEIKGDIPNEGYILVNNNCEVAYSFYDSKNVVSKNFKEDVPTINKKDTAPVYGLKWQSNKTTLDDTYTRTFDSGSIEDNSVNVQKGNNKATNVFDDLDIYKDILPYTDEFGNEFILIPKFYISKTKEVTDTEVIWNYAVSKQRIDNTYYLPSNFVDEGVDNKKHIELPYVLIGKYESGTNGKTGDEEMLVSKSGLMPKVEMNINTARTLVSKYNNIEGIKGYQQYDIHVHDLLTILFAIEFKTMNSQNIMNGYVGNTSATITGGSDEVSSSSGTIDNDGHNSIKYRGIENLWGNVWAFLDGINIDQNNGLPNTIYTANNARYYSSDSVTKYYEKLEGYNKLDLNGKVIESGFDKSIPFVNLPIKINDEYLSGVNDYFYQITDPGYMIMLVGGRWSYGNYAGLSEYCADLTANSVSNDISVRIIKTPLLN